ncbi:hypothetical protein HaLaN_21774, partial [Haematococcus lacustris]
MAGDQLVSPECMAVLRSMLQLNPDDRPSIGDLMTTAWFRQQLPKGRLFLALHCWSPHAGALNSVMELKREIQHCLENPPTVQPPRPSLGPPFESDY